eukprot:53359-Rhodomonas_salina.1
MLLQESRPTCPNAVAWAALAAELPRIRSKFPNSAPKFRPTLQIFVPLCFKFAAPVSKILFCFCSAAASGALAEDQ